jgi:UDPglucose 6-dehydrogenase
MIHGDGTLADALRQNFTDCPDWLVWAAWDTPIMADGQADYVWINHELARLARLVPGRTMLISSQVHVGTTERLAAWYPDVTFGVIPENVRAKTAAEDWVSQDRIVYGAQGHDSRVIALLAQWTDRVILTSPTTAEFTKHALNGFLALEVEYAAEIAELAEKVGADPEQVADALMADGRIGRRAYLRPGGTVGPHLGREIHTLHFVGGGPLIDRLRQVIR